MTQEPQTPDSTITLCLATCSLAWFADISFLYRAISGVVFLFSLVWLVLESVKHIWSAQHVSKRFMGLTRGVLYGDINELLNRRGSQTGRQWTSEYPRYVIDEVEGIHVRLNELGVETPKIKNLDGVFDFYSHTNFLAHLLQPLLNSQLHELKSHARNHLIAYNLS
jgi:hypothetical protein